MRISHLLLCVALSVHAQPALACETEPDISQLPGETIAETSERFKKTHSDQWVIRAYDRESYDYKNAPLIYVARVISNNRADASNALPSSLVQPIGAIRGALPKQKTTLTEVLNHSCANTGDGYGDGQGTAAKIGNLIVVFDGLPKTKERPNGIDSIEATNLRTFELVDLIFNFGKEVPEDLLWGREKD